MRCVPKLTEEYVERMEDVVDLYARPQNPHEPVVCLDEKSVQLLRDARAPLPGRPGKILRRDYEYKRNGTANVFCAVEPKAGKHMTVVTPNRKGPEFAKMMGRIARAYPKAKTIHVVLDNLNTHREKPLREYFGKRRGGRLWKRFTAHYTPKHASWLNQAEIEIGLFSRECLGRLRAEDCEALTRRADAWNRRVNRSRRKIGWKFTVDKAREKFGYRLAVGNRLSGCKHVRPLLGCDFVARRSHGYGHAPSSRLVSPQNRPAKTTIRTRSEH